jgi:hypothetical protein
MRQALVNENADLAAKNAKYVMRITGDNEEGKAELDNFIFPESRYPVIATTSKLMTTGIDAQTCKLIVLDQRIDSMTEFKQIIGRGTRINEDYGKYYFTIIDFKKATERFADRDFDGDPVQIYSPKGPDDPLVPPDTPEDETPGEDFTCTETGMDDKWRGAYEPGTDEEFQNVRRYVVDNVEVKVAAERVQYFDANGKLITESLKDYSPKDRVDIIITNPPFGGMEEDGIENNFPRKYQTRETADLFMALIMHLLKHDTGRAAVVLPDGFLFGEGVKSTLKRELLEEFNLHTIVRLPKGVFSPYTGIATNILFFEKGGPTKDIWFFEHPYPEGYKSYSRSKPLTIGEFDREKKWWGGAERKGRKTTEYAWKVPAKEIPERNYNLDCKNPHEVELSYGDPEELMQAYLDISRELQAAQAALKAELARALEDSNAS